MENKNKITFPSKALQSTLQLESITECTCLLNGIHSSIFYFSSGTQFKPNEFKCLPGQAGLLLDPRAVLVDARVNSWGTAHAVLGGERSHTQQDGLEEDVDDEPGALVSGANVSLGRLSAEHIAHEVGHMGEGNGALLDLSHALEAHLQAGGKGSGVLGESESGDTSKLVGHGHLALGKSRHNSGHNGGGGLDGGHQEDDSQIVVQRVGVKLVVSNGTGGLVPGQLGAVQVSKSNGPEAKAEG